MKLTDKIGRATFHHIAPQRVSGLTNREVRWLKHIERHGPQSSLYLYELTKDTHRCKDTALRQMQKLRAGGYLRLPRQQRATEHANFNTYIYDLTPKAQEYMFDRGIEEPTFSPHGHWVHAYMTSCVSSSIDIAAARDGVRYIPAHNILAINGATLTIPIGQQKLIPDQLFALDYGAKFRAFALEVDRGTEPKTTGAKRKSIQNSIDLYSKMIERQVYKSHYGLKAPLLVLWVFSSKTNEAQFLEMLKDLPESVRLHFLTQSVEGFHQTFRPPNILGDLYTGNWSRSGSAPGRIAI
ncbi:MAG: replication-relaxation family protein [Gallionellaceae bacterium]